jgi:hypothetical protein
MLIARLVSFQLLRIQELFFLYGAVILIFILFRQIIKDKNPERDAVI